MTYRIKVSGTTHEDDWHGTTYTTQYANSENFHEVLDDMVITASMEGWTRLKVEYQCINVDGDTAWLPVEQRHYV